MKKELWGVLVILMMLPIVFLATSEPYISYIEIPIGSILTGSDRKHVNSNHHIKLYTTYLEGEHGEISGNNKLTVQLEKKSLLGHSVKGTETIL